MWACILGMNVGAHAFVCICTVQRFSAMRLWVDEVACASGCFHKHVLYSGCRGGVCVCWPEHANM